MVVYFPPDFAAQFARFHEALVRDRESEPPEAAASEAKLPSVEIYPNLAKDASKAGHRRVFDVLDRLARENRPAATCKTAMCRALPPGRSTLPRTTSPKPRSTRRPLWSKILPFVLLIWALTGAFYPAIDLCAGEKERGTLETLLSSPAERIEIVWGKLLTIMIFSMATAVVEPGEHGDHRFVRAQPIARISVRRRGWRSCGC